MWTSIQDRLEKKEAVPEADYRKAALSLRPAMIRPMDSKNILIEGIHVVGSSFWTIHLLYCENVVVRNVIVETYPGANPDGIDIDSSREVRVSDSYFDTGDDAIVIKSGKGVDGRRVGRPYRKHHHHQLHFRQGPWSRGCRQRNRGRRAQRDGEQHRGQGNRDRHPHQERAQPRRRVENLRFDNWVIDNPLQDRNPGDQLLRARFRRSR